MLSNQELPRSLGRGNALGTSGRIDQQGSNLLPVVLIRMHREQRNLSGPGIAELRLITPVFAVSDQYDEFGAYTAPQDHVDLIIAETTLRFTAELSGLVAVEWRRRFAALLLAHHSCRIIAHALLLCGTRVCPPSKVRELAEAGGVSREHFARTLRSQGAHPALSAKRLIDAFVVLQILVMRAMGMKDRPAARHSQISYRTFLRARDRLEHDLPGSTENFRALLVHVDARVRSMNARQC